MHFVAYNMLFIDFSVKIKDVSFISPLFLSISIGEQLVLLAVRFVY